MFGLGRGRATWAVPLLLFLAILLAAALAYNVANLDTGGEAIPSVSPPADRSPLLNGEASSDALFRGLLVVFLAAFIAITVFVYRRRGQRTPRVLRPMSWMEILATFVSVIFFLAMVLVFRSLTRPSEAAPSPTDPTNPAGGGGPWPTASGLPADVFLIGGLLVGLLAVAFLLRRSSWLPVTGEAEDVLRDRATAAQAVRETIEHLELGGDVRSSILTCYHRFCLLLGERGVEDQRAMTAHELETAAIERLRVPVPESSQLTSLFEEARYSLHPLGEDHRERAVRSLESIRAALEA